MADAGPRTRKEALQALAHFGIRGADVYLIDLIPLIEMIWADGKAQEAELGFLDAYLARHVEHVNELAGMPIASYESAAEFLDRFLDERPDPELLATLRSFVRPIRLSSSDRERDDLIRKSLLATCLDIAASSVTEYPYPPGGRFDPDEKRTYFEILESL